MKKLFSVIPCLGNETLMLRKLTVCDADGLRELTESAEVYRFLPTFLFEKKQEDAEETIRRMYDACLEESLILGIFFNGEFSGLAEVYGLRVPLRKVSIGYRLLPRFWGKGIATEAVRLLVGWLLQETDVRIITASVLPENCASAGVLKKNGFRCALHSVPEDWGYERPVLADKWIRVPAAHPHDYKFHSDF